MKRFVGFESPVGFLRLVGSAEGLVGILWAHEEVPAGVVEGGMAVLEETRRQLEEYFAGGREAFDVPLAAEGTVFQRQVWGALGRIPYGEVRSYGEIARGLGMPTASRAVGAANGRNPIPIIVPCHRVVGASGKLTGFAGGIECKRKLLELERRVLI